MKINSLSTLILGSCVSRDVLNFDRHNKILLLAYFARSSFASMFSARTVNDRFSAYVASEFQRRMVKADLLKEFQNSLATYECDLVLIDFIDERFSLFEFCDGSLCTVSNELLSSGFDPKLESGRLIKSQTAEYYTLWEIGWSRFIREIKQAGFIDKIRVNAVYWANSTSCGDNYLPIYTPLHIERANQFLTKMYERVKKDLKSEQIMHFERDLISFSADQHPWGKSPFHFNSAYYEKVLRNIIQPYELNIVRSIIDTQLDLLQWGGAKSVNENIESLIEGILKRDGVHRFELISNIYLDCFTKGFEGFEIDVENKNVLVCLCGAISNRLGKKAPFFVEMKFLKK